MPSGPCPGAAGRGPAALGAGRDGCGGKLHMGERRPDEMDADFRWNSNVLLGSPRLTDALPCAQTPCRHMGARQLILTDMRKSQNDAKNRHPHRQGPPLPCATPSSCTATAHRRHRPPAQTTCSNSFRNRSQAVRTAPPSSGPAQEPPAHGASAPEPMSPGCAQHAEPVVARPESSCPGLRLRPARGACRPERAGPAPLPWCHDRDRLPSPGR